MTDKELKAKAEAEAKAKAEAEAKAKAEAEVQEEELREVYLPKRFKGDDSQFVSVNGRRILIQRGVRVKVPKTHAEVIKHSIEQTAASEEFIEKVSADT